MYALITNDFKSYNCSCSLPAPVLTIAFRGALAPCAQAVYLLYVNGSMLAACTSRRRAERRDHNKNTTLVRGKREIALDTDDESDTALVTDNGHRGGFAIATQRGQLKVGRAASESPRSPRFVSAAWKRRPRCWPTRRWPPFTR